MALESRCRGPALLISKRRAWKIAESSSRSVDKSQLTTGFANPRRARGLVFAEGISYEVDIFQSTARSFIFHVKRFARGGHHLL